MAPFEVHCCCVNHPAETKPLQGAETKLSSRSNISHQYVDGLYGHIFLIYTSYITGPAEHSSGQAGLNCSDT